MPKYKMCYAGGLLKQTLLDNSKTFYFNLDIIFSLYMDTDKLPILNNADNFVVDSQTVKQRICKSV